jgi:hypothetical protein
MLSLNETIEKQIKDNHDLINKISKSSKDITQSYECVMYTKKNKLLEQQLSINLQYQRNLIEEKKVDAINNLINTLNLKL